jgi:hypothetical protein
MSHHVRIATHSDAYSTFLSQRRLTDPTSRYSHPSLPTLGHDAIVAEMTRLEDVLIPIIEEIPTYMRPPYFDISPEVLATMAELGYKVVTASIDTKDYEHDDEVGINISYEKFLTELDAGGSIVLAHDIHYWTGESLLERMLIEISERGLTGMFFLSLSFFFLLLVFHEAVLLSENDLLISIATTVGECLGEPLESWYRPAYAPLRVRPSASARPEPVLKGR